MTNKTDTSTNAAPKKSNKKLWVIVAIVLGLLALDYFKFNYVIGAKEEAPVADSTTVAVDTTQVVEPTKVATSDTSKADSTQK